MIIIKKLLRSYVWTLPFILFFSAFFISFIFFSKEKRIVPSLLYISTNQALELLAHQQLNCRLLKEQESSWPAGTIIAQTPGPGKQVKAFQTVFITVAKPMKKAPVPCAIGLSRSQANTVFNSSYKVIWHPVYSPDIQHRCIAQINNDKEIILYESSNKTDYVIMPSFYKKTAHECRDFLTKYGITPTIIHSNYLYSKHTCNSSCIIHNQNPPAGTIISLLKPPVIQLKV